MSNNADFDSIFNTLPGEEPPRASVPSEPLRPRSSRGNASGGGGGAGKAGCAVFAIIVLLLGGGGTWCCLLYTSPSPRD